MGQERRKSPGRDAPRRMAVVGLLVNFGLAVVKLVAGLAGNSYALVADAVESFGDILGSAVVWGGLHIAARPADDNHPYGHGKAEALAAVAVALMIFAAGGVICVEAMEALRAEQTSPRPFTLAVLIGVVVVKETMFRVTRARARDVGSSAGHADAAHHRSDAITSLAAGVGIALAVIGGPAWASADEWAAIAASLVIFWNAWRLIRTPLAELMDAHHEDIVPQCEQIARSVEGVLDVEKTLARKSGRSYLLDMHVEVDGSMRVDEAHAIGHRVKDAIRGKLPEVADVLVHLEPWEGQGKG